MFVNFLPLPTSLYQSAVASLLIFGSLYGCIGLIAGLATIRIFGNAYRTLHLRKILGEDEGMGRRRVYTFLFGWWGAFYILIGFSFAFFGQHALPILFASLFSVEIFIYYQLRLSFPKNTPFEGTIALISYGIGTTFSFVVSLFTDNLIILTLGWLTVVVIWLFCSLYALRNAHEELAALVY
jgi:hypothetical protein